MNCIRCHGLMLEEHLLDLESSYGGIWACAWRCVNCGHRDDAVMQQHRQAQTAQRVGCIEGMETQEESVVSCTSDSVEQFAA